MTNPIEHKGSFAGKQLLVTDGAGGTSTVEELRRYLRRFPTREMLRYIAAVSNMIGRQKLRGGILQGVALHPHCLPYLALLSIECSNDYRGKPPDDATFARAVQMFNNLRDPMTEEMQVKPKGRSGLEFLMRLGRQQFEVQGELRHLIPRTLLILRDIWPSVPNASHVSPDSDIKSVTQGLGLAEVIILGMVAHASSEDGYVRPLLPDDVAIWPRELREAVDREAYARLLDWLSATYSEIRAEAIAELPADAYDQYRFNPLEVTPLVISDAQPVAGRTTYLVPIARLIWKRVTQGLYHDLSNKHRGGGGRNDFRVAFGYAFQEYVGLLLRKALGDDCVLPELKYGSKQLVDSPDWIVVEGDKAVIVEVKQSALFLETKLWGQLADARVDVAKTLAKAVKQLARFEADVLARKPGLEQLHGVHRFERLVVTYDNFHFTNSIVREVIEEMHKEEGATVPHVHLGPVEDIEYVLGHCWQGSLFELLESKRQDPEQDQMDFHDWMGHYLAESGDHRNPFLDGVFHDWMAQYGLHPDGKGTAEAPI